MTEFKGVQIEERILPALEKMLEDAKRDGCHLNITGGYVDKETQQTQYEQEVQRLMDSGGYTESVRRKMPKQLYSRGTTVNCKLVWRYSLPLQKSSDVDFGTTKSSDGLRKFHSLRFYSALSVR